MADAQPGPRYEVTVQAVFHGDSIADLREAIHALPQALVALRTPTVATTWGAAQINGKEMAPPQYLGTDVPEELAVDWRSPAAEWWKRGVEAATSSALAPVAPQPEPQPAKETP